jgi:acyl-[acyl-carrier-protein]-phospholipid O-acyltransferase/long-chain-fatty-acid--[acyl-carrier-protein] ligase
MLESLRVVIAGAEKLPESVRTVFQAKFNINILEGYGATETTPVASCNIPDQLDSSYWKVQKGNTPGSVGMPLPGSSVRIVDPDTLATLPIGEDGLIMIAGTQVMLGYLNNPEKTDEVIVEIDGQRWYKTGDKGHVSDDGFLFIVDRYSRFAKVGGEMISLGAVEQHIKSAISDAEGNEPFEVAAVNIPDDKKGEKVLLLVAGDKGFSDNFDIAKFKQQLIDSGMNSLMLPSTITCIEEIPKLGSGKVDFKGLSKIAKELQQ